MRSGGTCARILPLLLALCSLAAAQRLAWHTSYKEGRREAEETGKPLLISFRCVP